MQTMFKDGSVMISGRVGQDAEVKTVGEKNSTLCRFGVAVGTRDPKNKDSETIWVNCQCWHDVARYAAQIRKGDTIFAVGRISTYTTNEGKTYKNLDCEYVAIQGKGAAAPAPAAAPDTDLGEDFEELFSDDGVPF